MYHHLIPRTYLKSWCYSNDSIYGFSKNDLTKPDPLNINHHFGIQNYHSIKAGMQICTEEDLKIIFEPLSGYNVEYEGTTLQSLREFNQFYKDYRNWKIYYKRTGSVVPKSVKSTIHNKIEQNTILDIEVAWRAQYEDRWNSLVQFIEQRVLNAKSLEIESFNKGILMKFIVSLNWRSYKSNESMEEAIDFFDKIIDMKGIEILENERDITNDRTYYDWFKRNYLLKQFDEFLNGKGKMYDLAKSYIKDCTIIFLISNGKCEFLTSDNPSFVHPNNDGLMHVMPVTPKILICIAKSTSNKYYIDFLDDDDVSRYNTMIINNSDKKVLSNKPNIHFNKS